MNKLKDEYKNKIINTFSVLPSEKISETVVEPYNAVLALSEMIENSHENVCFDNEAMFNIYQNSLKVSKPPMDALNHLVSLTIAGVTSSIRYPGQLNTDLRKLCYNLCPFPKLHFLVPSFAPLYDCWNKCYKETTVSELIAQIFDVKNQMVTFDPKNEEIIAASAIFRGLMSTKQVEEQIAELQLKSFQKFSNQDLNQVHTAICDIPPCGVEKSATLLSNTSGINRVFNRLIHQYDAMLEVN